jgi:hypothetical protein
MKASHDRTATVFVDRTAAWSACEFEPYQNGALQLVLLTIQTPPIRSRKRKGRNDTAEEIIKAGAYRRHHRR